MEIIGGPLQVTLSPSTAYTYLLTDQNTLKTTTGSATSDGAGVLTIPLPLDYTKYDGWFSLEVSLAGNVVYMDTVTATRPYVDPSKIVTYALPRVVTLAEATEYERIARLWIDSILGFSFDFTRKDIHAVGNGTDFLPVHERLNTIYSVKENNETIWQTGDAYPFAPSVGLYTVVRSPELESNNRMEFVNTWNTRYGAPTFVENYDYVIDADCGWPVVPQDIQEATLMIANDIACGNNRYSNKYIKSTGAGQQSIDYFYRVNAGTGNLIVDNILSKYVLESVRARVL